MNVLLNWLWFQKRYSALLLLNGVTLGSIHMNFICLKMLLLAQTCMSHRYQFWKRNLILENSETRWAANACRRSILYVYMHHWEFYLIYGFETRVCYLDLIFFHSKNSFDNSIIIGTYQNKKKPQKQKTKPEAFIQLFIVVISVICEKIKTLVFRLFIIETILKEIL